MIGKLRLIQTIQHLQKFLDSSISWGSEEEASVHLFWRTEDDTHVIPLSDFLGDVQERLVVEIELTILPSGINLGIYGTNYHATIAKACILPWLQSLGSSSRTDQHASLQQGDVSVFARMRTNIELRSQYLG